MNGMASGYLNSSPFDALTLAITMKIILSSRSTAMIGNPMIIKHNGMVSKIYRSIENWKLSDAFPFSFTQVDSSRFDNQMTRGPIIPPNGIKYPANAAI